MDTPITTSAQTHPKPDLISSKNEKRINCLNIRDNTVANPQLFIEQINQLGHNSSSFDKQWERSKIYWASILFEAFFLPCWWLFTFKAGFFGKYNKRLSVRLAFSPLILLIGSRYKKHQKRNNAEASV